MLILHYVGVNTSAVPMAPTKSGMRCLASVKISFVSPLAPDIRVLDHAGTPASPLRPPLHATSRARQNDALHS
jgi:hypothetical protein